MLNPILACTRVILFDAVGTLIYPDPPVAEAYFRVGCELGSTRSIDQIKAQFKAAYQRSESLFGLPDGGLGRMPTSDARERQRWRQVVGEVLSDLNASAAGGALERLWNHFSQPAHWRLFADVAEVWAELARRDYVLGIASNFDSRLEAICRGLAPLDGCRHLFISSQVGYPKPSPHFYRAVETKLALRPEEILLVGDDPTNDVQGAAAAGWQTQLLVRDGPLAPGAIRSLRDLLA